MSSSGEWAPAGDAHLRGSKPLHSAENSGATDARDRLHECGRTECNITALRQVIDFTKRLDELVLFLALDLFERPAEVLKILHPLEMADRSRRPSLAPDPGEELAVLPALADDPEIAHMKQHYRDELRAAIQEAIAQLRRDRLRAPVAATSMA